jgi:hypothetical protein
MCFRQDLLPEDSRQGHVREVGKLAYLRQTQRLVWNFGKTSRGLPKKFITNLSFQADEDLPTYSY